MTSPIVLATAADQARPLGQTLPDRAGLGEGRLWCALGSLFWVVIFCWLWIAAPPLAKALGLAWFVLGASWRAGYFVSLALALAWFGNNPGGPHHLYLIDMGLMGLVTRHLAERALGRQTPRPQPLDPWITLFVAFSWLTLFEQWRWIGAELLFHKLRALYVLYNHSSDADVSGVQCALKLTLSAGLYSSLRDRPWPMNRLRRYWLLMLAVLFLTAIAGWLNYVKWIPLAWWRGENPDIVARFGWPRLQSLYWHSGWYAQYIEALAPGALALGWRARRPVSRWILWSLALLLAVTQFFTMARAGWIALAGGYGTVIAIATLGESSRRALKKLAWRMALFLGTLGLLALLFTLLSPDFRHRLGELFVYRHRTDIWASALGMIRELPLGGVGLGNYYHLHLWAYPEGHPYWYLDKVTAHSLYLHLWAERGLIGLTLFLIIFIRTLWRLVRTSLKGQAGTHDEDALTLRWAILGGFVALALDGLFQYIFYIRTIEILFWMFVGWATWFGGEASPAPPCARARGNAWRWTALFAILAAVYTWENRVFLQPWAVTLDGINLRVGKLQVALPLPPGAKRVRLTLGSADPDCKRYPVTYTIRLGEKVLNQVVFKKELHCQQVLLDLPESRPPQAQLTVTASRTWSPWGYGLRIWPFITMGVLYLPPEAIPAPAHR